MPSLNITTGLNSFGSESVFQLCFILCEGTFLPMVTENSCIQITPGLHILLWTLHQDCKVSKKVTFMLRTYVIVFREYFPYMLYVVKISNLVCIYVLCIHYPIPEMRP